MSITETVIPTTEKETHTIAVVIPTAEEEFDNIKSTIQQIPSLQKETYDILLPQDQSFQKLLTENTDPETVNYQSLKDIFISQIYNPDDYQKGYAYFNSSKQMIYPYFSTLEQWKQDFGFKLFDQYNLVLTLYGPGGSFNPSTGVIVIKVDREGIPQRENPIASPLHEIIHIGIDKDITGNLPHRDRERLVDILCSEYLKIPNYQMQNYINPEIDKYIQNINLKDLPKQIEKYRSRYQPF